MVPVDPVPPGFELVPDVSPRLDGPVPEPVPTVHHDGQARPGSARPQPDRCNVRVADRRRDRRQHPQVVNEPALARATAVVWLTVLADQVTKASAVASLERGEEVNVFLGLDMTYVRNDGVAFGALSGGGPLLVAAIT